MVPRHCLNCHKKICVTNWGNACFLETSFPSQYICHQEKKTLEGGFQRIPDFPKLEKRFPAFHLTIYSVWSSMQVKAGCLLSWQLWLTSFLPIQWGWCCSSITVAIADVKVEAGETQSHLLHGIIPNGHWFVFGCPISKPAVKDGPSTWVSILTWEAYINSLAPGFSMPQLVLLQPFGKGTRRLNQSLILSFKYMKCISEKRIEVVLSSLLF